MNEKIVLVIEDVEATSRLLEVTLTMDGFDVIVCADGITGLEAALTVSPDVLLLDIGLPGMDGWEVLRQLRADPGGRHIPVLVITAYDFAESKTKSAAEADGVLGKPFQISHLRAEVAALAGQGRSGRVAVAI